MTDDLALVVRRTLRPIPDYPKPGILFQDITPVLADSALLRDLIEAMAAPWREMGVSHVVGIESRGFILAAPVALALGAGFNPIRKPGKLPWQTVRREYALEYGVGSLELHRDAVPTGARVLVVDDVLATGGTARAACELVQGLGGTVVGCSFLLEIGVLRGERNLDGQLVHRLITT